MPKTEKINIKWKTLKIFEQDAVGGGKIYVKVVNLNEAKCKLTKILEEDSYLRNRVDELLLVNLDANKYITMLEDAIRCMASGSGCGCEVCVESECPTKQLPKKKKMTTMAGTPSLNAVKRCSGMMARGMGRKKEGEEK